MASDDIILGAAAKSNSMTTMVVEFTATEDPRSIDSCEWRGCCSCCSSGSCGSDWVGVVVSIVKDIKIVIYGKE